MWYETKPARGKIKGAGIQITRLTSRAGTSSTARSSLGSLSKEKEDELLFPGIESLIRDRSLTSLAEAFALSLPFPLR